MAVPQIVAIWEKMVSNFLLESNDLVTIYYDPVRSGTDQKYDSFFNEGTDSSDPNDVGNISSNTPPPIEIRGKVHLDLYGKSISSNESLQNIGIGSFQDSDALFTCVLSNAILPDNTTVFDNSSHVLIDKDGLKYEVVAQKRRGLGSSFLLDVFMKLTNK